MTTSYGYDVSFRADDGSVIRLQAHGFADDEHAAGIRRPTIAFDLLPDVELVDALRELVCSMERRQSGKLEMRPPRTRKQPVDVREFVAALAPPAPRERSEHGTEER